MKGLKRFISCILVVALVFTDLPVQYSKNGDAIQVYAAEGELSDTEIVGMDREWLTLDMIFSGSNYSHNPDDTDESLGYFDYSISSVTEAVYMPAAAPNGSTISWTSSNEALIDLNGNVTRADNFQGATNVMLTATFTKGTAQQSTIYKVGVSPLAPTSDEQSVLDDQALLEQLAVSEGWLDPAGVAASHITLPTLGSSGSTISWESSNPAVIATDGTVNKPSYSTFNFSMPVTLTASISKGTAEVVRGFEIRTAYFLDKTPEDELAIADYSWVHAFASTEGWVSGSGYDGNRFDFPIIAPNGSSISWSSDHPEVIAPDGTITRPTSAEGDKYILVTFKVTRGPDIIIESSFWTSILADRDEEELALDVAWLTPELVLAGNAPDAVTKRLNLPTSGPNHSTISWSSSQAGIITPAGVVMRPSEVQGNQTVTLTATLSRNDHQDFLSFGPFTVCSSTSEEEAILLQSDIEWIYNNTFYGFFLNDIRQSYLNLPIVGENGSAISWFSSNPALVATNGTVTRPVFSYAMGHVPVTLTATISRREETAQQSYNLSIYPEPPTAEDRVVYYKTYLTDEVILAGNSADNVKTGLYLQTYSGPGYYGDMSIGDCTIAWHSSHPEVIAPDGTVTRPSKGQASVAVTLTATISYGEASDQKTFNYIVTPKEEFPLAINYGNFSITDRLQFNGISEVINTTDRNGNPISALQFKSYEYATGGSVFTKNKLRLGSDLSFSTAFSFRNKNTGSNSDISGNGGFTFTLQTVSSEVYGQNMTNESIRPSLSIAFTTGYSSHGSGQAVYNYLETNAKAFYNGNYTNESGGYYLGGTRSDLPTDYYNAWIEYDGTAKVLELWCVPSEDRPDNNYMHLRYENVDLGEILTGGGNGLTVEDVRDVYAGFMGSMNSMGAVKHNSEIFNWYFKNDSTPIDRKTYDFYDVSNVAISAAPTGEVLRSTVTISASGANGPVAGMPMELFTDFGSLSQTTVVTDNSGNATATLSAESTGVAHVKASAPGGATAEVSASLAATDEDCVTFDGSWLTNGAGYTQLLNGNSALNNVTTALYLPASGPNGTTISWSSDNAHINAIDGTVTLPSPSEGQQQAALTAAITKGTAIRTEAFSLTLKVPDTSAVPADGVWLTDERVLNGNSAFDNVAGNLSMPVTGQYGSNIIWISSQEGIIALNGTVARPTYTQGDQRVTLTAVIRKGSVEITKTYAVTVKALEPSDLEAVTFDCAWLTGSSILNENTGSDNITGNLLLPLLGPRNTSISWISSDINVIALNGAVTQPAFSQGKKKVVLTATVSKGSQTVQKSFEVTVTTLSQTDIEAVAADMKWLDISHTLGQNLSEFSVKENLTLPSSAPNNSLVTWTSDMPGVISVAGTVVRPTYTEGHKTVNLTAAFEKGSVRESKVFTYSVVAFPDTTPPAMTGMLVTANSTILGNYKVPFDTPILPWHTEGISIIFSEELNYSISSDQAIYINGSDIPAFSTTRWNNMIIFRLKGYLKPGASYELVIPSGYIADKYGNQPGTEIKLPIIVEEKPLRMIELTSSTPQDGVRDIPLNLPQVSFSYNYSDVVKGSTFNSIILRSKEGKEVPLLSRTLSGDTVTLGINTPLEAGVVYEMVIPFGAVRDRFTNESSAKTIQFRAKTSSALPTITNAYPSDGQTGVDIHQSVEVIFQEEMHWFHNRLKLRDSQGNIVSANTKKLKDMRNGVIITPYKPLKENTVYTIYGPYETAAEPSKLEFSQSFTTGANILGINKSIPSYEETAVPINGSVEIEFAAPVTRGPEFAGIKFLDSQGQPVVFSEEETGNKGILKPASDLNAEETYTVHIPRGAYKGAGDAFNDDYMFYFTTARKLEPASDFPDSVTTWLVDKSLQFNTDRLEDIFKSAKYEIASYQWDFGDGNSSEGKNATHIYNQTGDYLVKLQVKDSKGFSHNFERAVKVIPVQDTNMSVSHTGRNNMYLASGWPLPSITYNVKLECEGAFVPGETIGVQLYKNGVLQKNYENLTAGNGDSSYAFTFTPESNYIGNYQLVFTYNYPTDSMTVREPVSIQPQGATSFLRVQLYNKRNGEIYHEADYLNVTVDGKDKVAVREWVESLNEYVYTVREEFPILRYYKFNLKGFDEYSSSYGIIYNIGNLGDFYTRPPIKAGYSAGFGISELVNTDVLYRYYIEGVDVGKVAFAVKGDWRGLDPAYYELQTSSGGLKLKSESGEFLINPGRNFRVGDSLMVRMVSKNGVKTDWTYFQLDVYPKPSLMGQKLDVRYVDGIYELSLDTPFDGLTGGSIGILNGIPFLNGGNFGLGSDMPAFVGVIYKERGTPTVEMDFSGEAGYEETRKTTKPVNKKKKSSVKKVKAIGYDVEVAVEGVMCLKYDKKSREWKTEYLVIDVDGYGGKSWSSGYKIAGVVGVEGELKLGAFVGGTLKIDYKAGSDRKYSGIIRLNPEVTASVSGSYGVGDVTGSVTGNIPAEVHIPTGYIEANVGVKAKITASFLTYTETLYSKKLYGAHWDNGKEKLNMSSVRMMTPLSLEDFESEGSRLEPMERGYLNRNSVWLAADGSAQPIEKAGTEASSKGFAPMSYGVAEAEEPNPKTEVLMENIYPKAELQLVQSGDEKWLVWTDDNPDRDAVNRTQLHYSVLKNGTWSEPVWIDGDGTADFSPAAASVANGTLMAWQNTSQVISEVEGLNSMIENSEITVTESVYSSDGSSPKIITLTQDNKLDHSPRLAADGSSALMVWTKSEGLGFTLRGETEALKAPENSDCLYFSAWNGSLWSEPSEIQGSLPTILDSNLAVHQDEGLLLYTLDMDNDLSTIEDREVFARLYEGNVWGEALRISDNQLSDTNPKAAYINGKWLITWIQNGSILYKEGLNGEIKTQELLQNVQNDFRLAVNEGANPQAALVYKKTGEDNAQGLSASFYDMNKGVWSDEIPMAKAQGCILAFSPVFTGDGKLNLAYSEAEIITEVVPEVVDGVEKFVEEISVSDKVDLKTLTYKPIHDLTFDKEDGLQLSADIPLSDTVTTVLATVRNQGDFTENSIVDLYDGNPAAGGRLVASTGEKLIPARSSSDVELEWLVPSEEKNEYNLYAVVRPLEVVSERDESNNTINLNIITADIAVTGVEHENVAKDDYLVNAVIVNEGSRILKNIEVKLEHIGSGGILKTESIKQMEPGQEFPLSLLISAQGLEKDENGKINMILRAMLPDGVNENSTEDNIVEFALNPFSIVVDRAAPGQNEAQVAVDKAVTLGFNLSVQEGIGFDKITLADEELNVIAIAKVLEGDTLTLTPLSPLANSTQYTLTLPADALADAYGHTMEVLYSMSFTTTTASPEVIFAYPGDGMEKTALDCDIRLQFNQNVSVGPTFENIKMYGSNSVELPVKAAIEGEWLSIKPAGGLSGHTTYNLTIPRGSVSNSRGEAQHEDYKLTFTTLGAGETGDSGSSTGGNNASNNDESNSNKNGSYYAGIGGSLRDVELPVTVNFNTGSATVDLKKLAEGIFKGNENAVISIPPIPGVNTYTLKMSATSLSGPYGKASLTLNTGVGRVLIRSGMLTTMADMEGKTADITITVGDKTKLPEASRAAIGNRPLIQLNLTLDGKQTDWNNLAAPVTVSIPYTPTAAELVNPESIVIWYIDGSGRLISVPNGHYDPAAGTMTFSTTHFSSYAVGYNKVCFNDVAVAAWYNKAVSFIAARNITTGTGNGNFSPAAKLTRGEFIVLLMRAYGISPDENLVDNFSDAGKTYYTGYLAAAKQLGISAGVGNNMFAPEKEITRQEMSTLLYNALKVTAKLPEGDSGKTLSDFTDAGHIDTWAKDAMTLLVKTGIITGYGGKLSPADTTTRAEMAQVLYNLVYRGKRLENG